MVNSSRPVTQAIAVLGASPQMYQVISANMIPAIHFVLRSFLSLTLLNLAPISLASLLKFWSSPQKFGG